MATQVLDDLDGVFRPDGTGDIGAGKVTLPIIFGLTIDHPARNELADLVQSGRLARIEYRVRAILEEIETREYLVLSAFQECDRGLQCIAELPPSVTVTEEAGRGALTSFADAIMVGWEDLLVQPLVAQ